MSSQLKKIINENDFVLMEGAVVEILRRSEKVSFHPDLIHSHLIYNEDGAKEMHAVYKSYIDVAEKSNLPIVLCAPTWRANKNNVIKSGVKESINADAVQFIYDLKLDYPELVDKIVVGGTIGPKNDCYTPEEGLSAQEATDFHGWQIEQLIQGGADFIIAETLPNVNEAIGIARACSVLNIAYVISFVISRDGKILDGSGLLDAIKEIDKTVDNVPLAYFVNCAHPSFLCAQKQPKELFNRLIGYLANASDLDHCELDNADATHLDDISNWGDEMLRLNREFGIKILGGCCGTDWRHINYLRKNKR